MATHLENEQQLVALAKAGDQDAFTTLVRQYEKNIYRLVLNFVRDSAAAEDLLQETFLRAYRRLAQFDGDSRFYTWLVRIAVNCALMELRTRRRRAKTLSLDDSPDSEDFDLPREIEDWRENPEQAFSRGELRQVLQTALAQLPAGYRAVVQLRDAEGYSSEEAAQMLNISVSAAKSRLLRARLQLREYLSQHFRKPSNAGESPQRIEAGVSQSEVSPATLNQPTVTQQLQPAVARTARRFHESGIQAVTASSTFAEPAVASGHALRPQGAWPAAHIIARRKT